MLSPPQRVSPEDTLKSPRPRHHLFLNKPLSANGSNISVNEIPSTPHTPHTPIPGIRALNHLLSRHTYFRARITIHQISSVPFVSGEFGVRWKFKGVHTPTGQKQGLLDRVKARAERRTVSDKSDKGKAREDSGETEASRDRPSEAVNTLLPTEDGHVGVRQIVGVGRSASGPSSVPMTRSGTSSSHVSSVSSRSSHTDHSQHLSADWGTNSSSLSTNSSSLTVAPTPSSTSSDISTLTIPNTPTLVNVSSTPARGMTAFVKLKSHSVIWSHTLEPILKFDVDRENSQVLPNPLKLVVMQRVIPDDPQGVPQNARLGAVYLNLAEYINQGSVERRYLLKESKTNATLKLTIEMEYVSGESHFIPPPLAKGEILTGIAGFLEKDIVKKRPRALDIYGPYNDQEELEIDLLGTAKSARIPKTARSTRRPSDKSTPPDSDSDEDNDVEEEVGVAFDVQRLPFAYGTKTTEMLIDALFNPVKTTEKREESPFTVYEPPSPSATPTANGRTSKPAHSVGLGFTGVALDRHATIVPTRQNSIASSHEESSSSVYSTSSSSASVRTTTSEGSKGRSREAGNGSKTMSEAHHHASSAPEGRVVVDPAAAEELQIGGIRGWWRRHTRPGTPTQVA
ncbi:hypothetical protein GALMADRAFT_210142 [Galerina marginata CBS 339.88]|uniref:C2 NT-type domain-containing protein n=1 Tax=Galerina marginata (strain CBS 339.88) TaxID=685588 RepID=A0A067T1C9_GALM3|nr:hypothetical protein GALMADRAFT_210142 [Galerina marginata CBS 339.88]